MMTEGTATRRRARRPTEAATRLERLRQRNAHQLETQREAERRIEEALKAYVDADVSISALEHDRDEKIAAWEQQIEHARETARVKVERIRARQALAVCQLNTAGRTVEQIAELLEVPQKEARRLLSAGRTAAESDPPADPFTNGTPSGTTAPTDRQQPTEPLPAPAGATSEQRGLRGVDGHQDGADTVLVPTIPDSGGQRA